jgi:hypothetical protein
MKPCPSCGQANPDGALVCEFCKALFKKSPAPAPAPVAPVVAASAGPVIVIQGWSTIALIVTGLVGGALGFGLRTMLPRSEPPATPPPPAITVATPTAPGKPAVVEAAAPPPPPAKTPELALKAPPQPEAAPPPAMTVIAVEPVPGAKPAELKRFKVPYTAFEGEAQRIIVPVTFNGRVTAPMAVDTGAPGTFISFRLAERIGVLREGDARLVTAAHGLGGAQAAALVILDTVAIDEARTDFVPATVTRSISPAFEGLVGMDFLAGFSLEVDTREHVLVLKELPPLAAAPAGHDETWWRRNFSLLGGQRSLWKEVAATAQERLGNGEISAGGGVEDLKHLATFADAQSQQAELLAGRLERYAATHSVPLEWRR